MADLNIVETHDPEIMRIDTSSTFGRLIGVVVVAGAILLFVLCAQDRSGGSSPAGFLFILVAMLIVALFGLAMITLDGQVIIDRRLGKVVSWMRIYWWTMRRCQDLSEFEGVRVEKTGSRYPSWGVELYRNSTKAPRANKLSNYLRGRMV
jgi:hypothetical protein